MSNIVIDIAAEFTGKKAFKQADSAAAKLNSNIKKLAGTFGIAFGAQALVQFSKKAVKAFAEDEAAARRLSGAVENLGIGFANPAIALYISNLEKSAAVADDVLRPAFQGLLTTTGSLTQSQKLLNDAITISRASGIDLATVTEDLGKGYIGITKGLTKYNTGLTRAELQTKSFNEILGVILARSAGAAEDYLSTTSYKMDVLSIATGNASEIIGGGFVDALARASGGTEASDAAIFLETMAGLFNKVTLAAGTSVGAIPTLAQNLKKLGKDIFYGFLGKQVGVNLASPTKKEETKLTLSERKQQELLAKLEKDALRREKERLALLNKQNAAKKLQGVIDKANLKLGKAEDVFDLDKIQLNAALINQAQLLGKTTEASQILQITNDTARLNVKRSILDLEDAIAAKDEAAIIAATKKLDADLKILGTLQNQDLKLTDIKSILDKIMPKDLINISNLDTAIAKLNTINSSIGQKTVGTSAAGATTSQSGLPIGDYVAPIPSSGVSMPAILEFAAAATERANAMASLIESQNAASAAALSKSSLNKYDITINAGVGDPEAIARALEDYIRSANQRGTTSFTLL
jgi:hypothetical protein